MPVCVLGVCTCMYLCVLPSVTEVDETLSETHFPSWMDGPTLPTAQGGHRSRD